MLQRVSSLSLILCLLLAGCHSEQSEQKTQPADSARPESATGNGETPADPDEPPPAPKPDEPLFAKSFINEPAPEFVVEKWLTEKPEREGKMVLIDFWATWCGPCIKSIPKLNAFHRNHKDRVAVIGVSYESAEVVRAHPGPKINYALAIDPKKRMADEIQFAGYPYAILIDPGGVVRWQGLGNQLTEEVLKDRLDTYVR